MLSTLKILLFSGVIFMQDNATSQANMNTFISQNGIPTLQDERHDRAAKLVAQSSYVGLIEGDTTRALELLKEACNLEYGRACWYYAYETQKDEDALHAQKVLQQSCFAPSANKYNGESCTYLGIMVSHNKTNITENEQELYTRACELGDGWGCYRLASDFTIDEDTEQAKEIEDKALNILTQACNNGEAASCYFTGSIYSESQDKQTEARKFYEKGCKLGDGDSCDELQE
ncbi:hypothetical protein NHP164001_00760 [Helicobacter trogontum]|uniref:Beta-lactamase n=1 Tax=Helicobacter trogontum TaxID=50960 RepID=A0ABQ0D156_9HELI